MALGMGFYMKLQYAFLALCFISMGCMKTPNHDVDYGPEVQPKEVQLALDDLGAPDPFTIEKGEYAAYSYFQTVDVSFPRLVKQESVEVSQKAEDESSIFFQVISKTRTFGSDGSYKEEARLDTPALKKKPSSTQSMQTKTFELVTFQTNSGFKSFNLIPFSEDMPRRKTFHNLVKERSTMSIPSEVLSSKNCGNTQLCKCDADGLNCKPKNDLRSTSVTVDLVIWDSDTKGTKTRIKYVTSPDVPYFSNLLQNCWQEWIEIENRVVPVTVCKELKNFRSGTKN